MEIRDLQRSSQKAGAAHARACIFLQSVNVLRNINYVLLCIKTETQRATAAARGFGASQEGVILGGLRLLLALLPRCEKRWEAEILADEDCGHALAALANGHAPEGPLQRLVAESQKRLWILLRMVHLSSVLPIEAQGQLGSLVQRYARPILIEGRVPLQNHTLEMHKEPEQKDTILSVRKTRALPPSAPSQSSSQSFTSTGTGMRETLKQLRATRKDLTRILQRLSPEALLARSSEEELAMLHDIFSSAILLLASSNAPRTWSIRGRASSSGATPRAAIGLGYRYGERIYSLENLRTNILLRLGTTKGTQLGRSGSITDLRNPGSGNVEEVEIPLTAISEETVGEEEAENLWLAMEQAYPGWYGEDALQERKQALHRVSEKVRQLRSKAGSLR